jgi:hypothetical protein
MFSDLVGSGQIERAAYLGGHVDLSPSTASVCSDTSTPPPSGRYLADDSLAAAELGGRTCRPSPVVRVLHTPTTSCAPGADPLACSSFLFAGPVWDATRHYLRAGGWPLINSSHGDASIAVLEPSLTVVAAAPYRSDRYRVTTKRLHDCLLAMVWAGTGALDVTCELLADGQWQSSGDPRLAVPPAERLPLRRARVARGGQLRDVRP